MDVQRTQKMTACRVSLPLVRKMTALVTRWKAARPWIQCSRQSSWRIQAVSRIPLQYHLHLHWQNISKGRQSLSYWSPLRGDPLVWMTYLCNKMKDLRSQGLGLIFWLHQYVISVLFLRQMGILLSINRFCSFDVQLVQLKSHTLNYYWMRCSVWPTCAICSSVKFSKAVEGIFSPKTFTSPPVSFRLKKICHQ